MDKFLEKEGYVGGVYKVSTTKLKKLLLDFETEVYKKMALKYPNDQELGKEVRKHINKIK